MSASSGMQQSHLNLSIRNVSRCCRTHKMVKLRYIYVYNNRSGISTELKNAAQALFGQRGWKLIWADLFNDAFNLLKVTAIEYLCGEPKRLEQSQVDELDEIINKHLHVFSKHRNVTAVQPSFEVTNSVQT